MFYLATAAFTHGSSTISPTQEAGAESMHYAEFIDLELELGLNLLSAPKLSLDGYLGVNERKKVTWRGLSTQRLIFICSVDGEARVHSPSPARLWNFFR